MRTKNHPLISIKERFDQYVMPVPECGCWLWIGAINDDGYGRFSINRRNTHAHRVSWELHRGAIPPGMQVLHRCDIPPCVNPDHLFLGTRGDNIQDCYNKKRRFAHPKMGENCNFAKLTSEDVKQIRKDRRPSREIAQEFGIHMNSVARIRRRAEWKHI